MLYLMRKHAGSLMIKIILGAIVVVFVFWGIGSFRERRAGRVALVNGEPIGVTEYREAYGNIIQRLRTTLGNSLDEAMIEQLKVKQQALNQLIEQRLLVQEAEKLRLAISNNELAGAIRGIAAFQSNGSFDSRLYHRVLDLNRMTPEAFEELQKRSMLVERLERFVADGVKVSDPEIDAWISWQNTSVNIRYVIFEPGAYKNIVSSKEEIEAFFKENASAYQTEEQIKARYVLFDPKRHQGQVTVTEEDLKEYYDANSEAFTTPKTVEARHILVKTDPADPPELVEEKRKKLEGVLQRVQKGEDFAKLAKTYSEDSSKESGGLIGPFQKEMMIEPFAQAAFSLKPGEVSDLVRTQFGWHIIKAEKVNEAKTVSFAEAKEGIQKKLFEEKSKNLTYDTAEALYDKLIGGADFEKAAEKLKLDVITTDFFTRKAPPADLADPTAFASVAFGLQAGETSDVHEMKGVYYILQVVEKALPKNPELPTVLDRVKSDFEKKKQWEKAQADAEAFILAVKNGKPFEDQAKVQNLKVTSSGFFKRNDPIPIIGHAPEVAKAAFELTPDQRITPKAIKEEKGYFAIILVEKTVSAPTDVAAEKEKIKGLLGRQKQMLAFNTLVSHLKSQADISVEEGFNK